MMFAFLQYTFLLSCGSSIFTVTEAKKDIIMERELHGSGFHRNLRTVFSLPVNVISQHLPPNCGFLLSETLPPGVYADPFQVQSLVSYGGPKVIFDREVDIEAAEVLSKSHELFIFPNINEQELIKGLTELSVSLPIHARYHRPSTDPAISHITVTLLHPGLYSNCSSISGMTDRITAPCDTSNTTVCNWIHLPYMSSSPLVKLHVPVGQVKDKPLVVVVTLIVSVTVCATLIKVIWSDHNNMHNKVS